MPKCSIEYTTLTIYTIMSCTTFTMIINETAQKKWNNDIAISVATSPMCDINNWAVLAIVSRKMNNKNRNSWHKWITLIRFVWWIYLFCRSKDEDNEVHFLAGSPEVGRISQSGNSDMSSTDRWHTSAETTIILNKWNNILLIQHLVQ